MPAYNRTAELQCYELDKHCIHHCTIIHSILPRDDWKRPHESINQFSNARPVIAETWAESGHADDDEVQFRHVLVDDERSHTLINSVLCSATGPSSQFRG